MNQPYATARLAILALAEAMKNQGFRRIKAKGNAANCEIDFMGAAKDLRKEADRAAYLEVAAGNAGWEPQRGAGMFPSHEGIYYLETKLRPADAPAHYEEVLFLAINLEYGAGEGNTNC